MAAESGSQSSGLPLHEGDYAVKNLELKEGKVPKLTSDKIYSQTLFSRLNFWKGYTIQTFGEWYPLDNKAVSFPLVTEETIDKYCIKYAFVHIGFVQVSIKALVKLGPDASVTVTLRDLRHADQKKSTLVAFESSVSMDSPINFNLYPDMSCFLSELFSDEPLHLAIQPQGCDIKDNTKHLHMRFRMCYKLFKTSLEAQPLIKGPRLEIDTQKSHVLVPVDNGDGVVLQRRKE
ncbi:hypothetical protein L6164_003638 [Bauhinia variegata]|uniref:Uncharacterized protein n=1 Tax=Bauhinia variegata TaxID=167791 RepID=A0ACB9Q1Y0_BAUVA|nr:hypothetical protein L6164_003638 [Bauhinia variegata]